MDRHSFVDENPLLGESAAFQEALEHVSHIAPLNRPVLIIGERGTGKELFAARLHFLSPRWERPFLRLNCAALTETLLESELFGHEAGAFTGATRRHVGRFELADGGTLFLDELANTSLRLQEKILRVVEYGDFERVGSNQTVRVDVRILGATNVDLPRKVEEGTFRADLLDRLAFDVITIPPLRARGDDVLLLADHFGTAMARDLGLPLFPGFTPPVRQRLIEYRWPGNVREIKNVVERATYRWGARSDPIADIEFDPFDSPYRPDAAAANAPEPAAQADEAKAPASSRRRLKDTVRDIEIELLSAAMERNQFNQRRAAEDLGLTYHQLRGYLRKHDLLPRR